MKRLKSLYLLASLALFSCSDFLEKEPEVTIDAETVDFNELNNMYQPVSGVYSWLRQEGTHWAVYALTISRDDDVDPGTQGDLWKRYNIYNYDASAWFWNEPFSVLYYRLIKYCNTALEDLQKFQGNCSGETLKKNLSYQGEVRILRAYSYYRLVQLFGAVPILESNTQTDLRRRSVNSVYDYALADLEFAMENSYRIRPNQMEHMGAVSAYTAEMLAAKIYQNQNKHEKVYELTKDIIQKGGFSLYPDFKELFKIPGKLCDESLFEIQTTDFGTGSGDVVETNSWFLFQGPANNGNISGWGWISPTESFRNWAADRGETLRAQTSFLYADSTTEWGDYLRASQGTETGCYNGKAYTPFCQLTEGRTAYGCNNNVRVFRYADVLLMYAEACLRTNKDTKDALDKFNMVRERAEMPTLANITVDDVLDERRMELCMEWGERFNDLVRTGKAEAVLGPMGYTAEKQYLPLPKAAIDITPQLAEDIID